jgi:hypothetical protein
VLKSLVVEGVHPLLDLVDLPFKTITLNSRISKLPKGLLNTQLTRDFSIKRKEFKWSARIAEYLMALVNASIGLSVIEGS